jgi:hypothetical protein
MAAFPLSGLVFMPRFHCPLPLPAGATVELPETVAHHLHVLRQAAGDERGRPGAGAAA